MNEICIPYRLKKERKKEKSIDEKKERKIDRRKERKKNRSTKKKKRIGDHRIVDRGREK